MSTIHEAEQEWLEPPEDGPDYLADKPEGSCPWCGRQLKKAKALSFFWCHKWADGQTEDENRALYAEERLKDDKHEALVSREILHTYRDME